MRINIRPSWRRISSKSNYLPCLFFLHVLLVGASKHTTAFFLQSILKVVVLRKCILNSGVYYFLKGPEVVY